MSVSIDSNGVTLTGDAFGVNWARKQLAAAPVAAVKMQLVSRAYFLNNISNAQIYTNKGWDPCAFFGLGFENTIYDFASSNSIAPTDFFGNITITPPYDSGPLFVPDVKAYATQYSGTLIGYTASPMIYSGSGYFQQMARMDGIGGVIGLTTQQSVGSAPNGTQMGLCYPIEPTKGALFTMMHEVWGSSINKSVYMRQCANFDGLAEGDAMFGAMTGKTLGSGITQILENTIHGDVTSNWRNSDGTMNFPRWLKIKCPLPEYSLRLKYWKIRYFDASNTVIYEQSP